jgi:hypothetical protein
MALAVAVDVPTPELEERMTFNMTVTMIGTFVSIIAGAAALRIVRKTTVRCSPAGDSTVLPAPGTCLQDLPTMSEKQPSRQRDRLQTAETS